MRIILGSQSSGRKKILKKMGYEFEVMTADIDEKQIRFEDPVKLTLALANAKADALLPKIKTDAVLITADIVVSCNGKIFEKPSSDEEAKEYLRMCAKYSAETIGSVVVVNTKTGVRVQGTDICKIWFKDFPQDVIDEYVATRDPFLHAGGFDYEHPLLFPYLDRVEGEPESVIGLPMALTEKLISLVVVE
jgi:septum formation protein